MSIQVGIHCSRTENGLVIRPSGAALVEQVDVRTIPYSSYLMNAGSSQMAITTGTLAAPVLFYVSASEDYDTLITSLNFFISGSAAVLNEFGTGTALTNGCYIYFTDPRLGEVAINPLVKSNYDLVRLANGSPAFGSGTSAYQISNAIGTAEAFNPVLDLTKLMPHGKGILLPKNSKSKLVIAIRDNTLTGRAVDFNCIASGEQFL